MLFDLGGSAQIRLVNLCTQYGKIPERDEKTDDFKSHFYVNLQLAGKIYNTYTKYIGKKTPEPPKGLEGALKELVATSAPFNCRIPKDAAYSLWKAFEYKKPKVGDDGKLANLNDYI